MKPANKLTIRSLHKGWCDNDEIILHACFELLVNCIENEKLLSKKLFDWEHSSKDIKEKKIETLIQMVEEADKKRKYISN